MVFLGTAGYRYFFENEEEEEKEDNDERDEEGNDDKKKDGEETYILLITSAVTLLFLFLSSYIEVAFRMSYYMFIVSLVIMTKYIFASEDYKIIKTGSFAILFLLHFYIECTHGLAGALDYTSNILGIF